MRSVKLLDWGSVCVLRGYIFSCGQVQSNWQSLVCVLTFPILWWQELLLKLVEDYYPLPEIPGKESSPKAKGQLANGTPNGKKRGVKRKVCLPAPSGNSLLGWLCEQFFQMANLMIVVCNDYCVSSSIFLSCTVACSCVIFDNITAHLQHQVSLLSIVLLSHLSSLRR